MENFLIFFLFVLVVQEMFKLTNDEQCKTDEDQSQ